MSLTHLDQPARHWVIVPAAGVGSRMQSDLPKQYLSLDKQCVLEHSLKPFLENERFQLVSVGLSKEDAYFSDLDLARHNKLVTYVGGSERAQTVLNGLNSIASLASEVDWVWVHDAARPCLSLSDIERLFNQLESFDSALNLGVNEAQAADIQGALLAAPMVDTIKYSEDGCQVDKSIDRAKLWRALTPQVFRFSQLRAALEMCLAEGRTVTDEASAIEMLGGRPRLVEGSEINFKVTRPGDVEKARDALKTQGRLGSIAYIK